MRWQDIKHGKLYVNRAGNEFRYLVPFEYREYARVGCGLPRDFYYLLYYGWDTTYSAGRPFGNQLSTFKAWAEREATAEEYAALKAMIDADLRSLEREGKKLLRREKRSWAKIAEMFRQQKGTP